ncbi:MAG: 2-oxoglutarate dehydrogenase E1 component, partial [Minicystis sp.]
MTLDFGINTGFVEELYAQYLENPASVDQSWRTYFDDRLQETAGRSALLRRANEGPITNGNLARSLSRAAPAVSSYEAHESRVLAEAAMQARVYKLLNAYRVRGHLFAHLNPLDLPPQEEPAELDLANFSLTPADLDKPFPTIDLAGMGEFATLREIIQRLEETYCRAIGVEFTHIDNPEQRIWLQQRMEASKNHCALGAEEQLRILTKLSDAEIFEQFIQRSYGAGAKRFSLEGSESLIPLLDLLIERAGAEGADEIVFGMAHRGRLNVMANILDKSPREIFAAFEDADAERYLGGGDVKYHLGYSTDRVTESGKTLHLTLTFNPSHLEFVNPVVEGR